MSGEILGEILVLINQFGLVSICSLLAGALIRHSDPNALRSALIGAVFGLGCGAAMLSPLRLEDGGFVDLRSLFIGFSTGLFGLTAGSITMIVAVAIRLQLGDPGAIIGVTAILVSFGASVLWRRAFPSLVEREASRLWPLALLGVSMSAYLTVAAVWPDSFLRAFDRGHLHFIAIVNVLGTILMGSLIVGALRTISKERKFSRLAMSDPLTGLLNRRGLSVAYETWQAVAMPGAGALVISADVDRFKAFNESFGHQLGDRCLIAVAGAMRRALRNGDLAARVGGDEFVLIMRDVAPEDSRRVMNRIRRQLTSVSIDIGGGKRLPVPLTFAGHYALANAPLQDGLNQSDLSMMTEKRRRRDAAAGMASPQIPPSLISA